MAPDGMKLKEILMNILDGEDSRSCCSSTISVNGLTIQVAYSVLAGENINTLERELAGLDKLSNRFPDINLKIITFDEEGHVESKKGNTVEILPAWKFLLS